jgi:hypothetical protein
MVLMRAADLYTHINDVGGPDAYPVVLLHGSPEQGGANWSRGSNALGRGDLSLT